MLAGLEGEIRGLSAKAEDLEERHQKRLHVIKALRAVFRDMGFAEVSPPDYEDPKDRTSPVVIEVDTRARGRIRFTIDLERISGDSELLHEHCIDDFAALTDALQNAYGIGTAFQMPDGTPLPRLIRKGEQSLPGTIPAARHDERPGH